MNNSIREVFSKYIRETDGTKYFTGDSDAGEDCSATMTLAAACPFYKDDVAEETILEDALSCYNCLFRRWTCSGFSCHKGFPVN